MRVCIALEIALQGSRYHRLKLKDGARGHDSENIALDMLIDDSWRRDENIPSLNRARAFAGKNTSVQALLLLSVFQCRMLTG
jgi:hypothetical protein